MSVEGIDEARRQATICNACRYCEGYCSVFPAMHRLREFSDGDLLHLANLCHNCRGCHYACQYAPPHEFAVNIPKALANLQAESWKRFAWPANFAGLYDRAGTAIALALILSTGFLFWLAARFRPESGEGFYAVLSHGLMVAVFAPAFLLPLLAVGVAVARYWKAIGGGKVAIADLSGAGGSATRLENLSGGHGEGCNFEDGDRFSNARRWFHQMVVFGFLLCLASTSSGTVLHYAFDMPAPYGPFSLPKLLGVPGGVLLCIGSAALAWLKMRADPDLGRRASWGGEMAFVLLLFAVSFTGLVLYAATGTSLVSWLLPLHLGCVLAFFLTAPYSKMTHGFFRLAALVHDASTRRSNPGA